jgi:hypothetical protein
MLRGFFHGANVPGTRQPRRLSAYRELYGLCCVVTFSAVVKETGMSQSTTEKLSSVVDYKIAIAERGNQFAIAVKFLLRDGSTVPLAIPGRLARGLATQMLADVGVIDKRAANKKPKARHH